MELQFKSHSKDFTDRFTDVRSLVSTHASPFMKNKWLEEKIENYMKAMLFIGKRISIKRISLKEFQFYLSFAMKSNN